MAEPSQTDSASMKPTQEDKHLDKKGPVDNKKKDGSEEEHECAVCLQTCIHPVKLPCSHIFCFLCVKGVTVQSRRCAMCRQPIPPNFLDNPNLLSSLDDDKKDESLTEYQWFYEGRNGWWQYDERTSKELEDAFSSGLRSCEVLVAGYLYIIDFDRMIQLRRNDHSRKRRIKRDLSSIPKKGVAGIKLVGQSLSDQQDSHTLACINDLSTSMATLALNTSSIIEVYPSSSPVAPSNTPQTPHTPSTTSSHNGSPENYDSSQNIVNSISSHPSQSSDHVDSFGQARLHPNHCYLLRVSPNHSSVTSSAKLDGDNVQDTYTHHSESFSSRPEGEIEEYFLPSDDESD